MGIAASPAPSDVFTLTRLGFDTYRKMLVPATGMALAVFAVYGGARFIAASAVQDGRTWFALLVDGVGLIAATVVSLPWFKRALATVDGDAPSGVADTPVSIGAMLGAAFFFWAGVLLGLRYLFGIPSVVVLIWYAFFGYAVADGNQSALRALGTSVRIGQGRRGTVAALGVVLLILNVLAASPLGFGQSPVTVVAASLLLAITTNVSMGAGAHLYRRLLRSEGT